MITPAITVLGAIEGLNVATPAFESYIVPLSVVILFVLFLVQRFGTSRVGLAFGPIMAAWFVTIGLLGLVEIAREPRILLALNPWHGLQFFAQNGRVGFLVLARSRPRRDRGRGALCRYGALSASGRFVSPWFGLVFPALLFNYFGQGALLLRDPSAVTNPFYNLAPRALLFPLVVLAAAAAVIASQALISGAFSLTQQAVQLGYSPRVHDPAHLAQRGGADLHPGDQ
jgi:KUP system potassium uptake protein